MSGKRIRQCLVGLVGVIVIPWGGYLWYQQKQYRAGLERAQQAIREYRFTDARDHLLQLLQRRPEEAQLHFLLGQTARRAHAYPDAVEHLGNAAKLGWPKEEIHLEEMLLRAQQGDRSVGPQLYALLEKDLPQVPLILEVLIQQHVRAYELSVAKQLLDKYLEREPNNLEALLGRGYVYERLFLFAAAVKDYRRAVQVHPDSLAAREKFGEILLITGPAQEALEQFQFLAQKQETPAILLGLAKSLRQLGQNAKARECLGRLLDQQPKNVPALIERGKLAISEQEPAVAEPFLRQAVQLAPHDRDGHYNLAQCLQQLNRLKEALQHHEEYQRIDADLKKLGALTKEVLRKPADAALRYEVGVLFLRNGDEDEGLRWLGQALERDPQHRPTHTFLADYFDKKGNWQLAQKHRQVLKQEKK